MTRRRESGGFKKSAWYKYYRNRMIQGLEYCRHCKRKGLHASLSQGKKNDTALTIDHIIPHSRGGFGSIDNFTILCVRCQLIWGNQPKTIKSLVHEILEYGDSHPLYNTALYHRDKNIRLNRSW